MDAKEYLLQIKEQSRKIRKQQEYIQRLKDSLGVAGVSYDMERVQSSPDPDKFAKIFGQIDDENDVLEVMKNSLVKMRVKIISQIHQLGNVKFEDVLNLVYVDGMSLKKAASAMCFSYAYTKEIHSAALLAFEEKFFEEKEEKFLPESYLNPTLILPQST